MAYTPLRDLIVVKLDPVQETSVSGLIVVPDSAREKPDTGEVISVGPGVRNKDGELVPLAVVPGDRVIIGKGAGREIKIDSQPLLIIREDDIMVVLDK